MSKNFIIGIVVLALAIFGGLWMGRDTTVVQEIRPGAVASPDIYGQLRVHGTLVSGGCATAIATTSATYTLSADEMDSCGVISITDTAGSAALALTTPASSTIRSIPNPGDRMFWVIDNLHSAAATTTTITAGAGFDLDGTTANDDVINGGVSGTLRCWRLATTDIRCIVEEMVDAG